MTYFIFIQIVLILMFMAIIYINDKSILKHENANKNYLSLEHLQKIFVRMILGNNDNGINEINLEFLKSFNCMYSTIVLLNGANFEVAASNVEQKYWQTFTNLSNDPSFQKHINNNTVKYITTSGNLTIEYANKDMRNIKSVMFVPLYFKEVLTGYWVLEDGGENAFNKINSVELSTLKDKLIALIKITKSKQVIKKLNFTDKATNLYNNIYLHTDFYEKNKDNTKVVFAMLAVNNLKELNSKFTKPKVTEAIVKLVDKIKLMVDNDTVFIRYLTNQFVLAFNSDDENYIKIFMKELLLKISSAEIYIDSERINFEFSYSVKKFLPNTTIKSNIDILRGELK